MNYAQALTLMQAGAHVKLGKYTFYLGTDSEASEHIHLFRAWQDGESEIWELANPLTMEELLSDKWETAS